MNDKKDESKDASSDPLTDKTRELETDFSSTNQNVLEERRSFLQRTLTLGILSLSGVWLLKDIASGQTAAPPAQATNQSEGFSAQDSPSCTCPKCPEPCGYCVCEPKNCNCDCNDCASECVDNCTPCPCECQPQGSGYRCVGPEEEQFDSSADCLTNLEYVEKGTTQTTPYNTFRLSCQTTCWKEDHNSVEVRPRTAPQLATGRTVQTNEEMAVKNQNEKHRKPFRSIPHTAVVSPTAAGPGTPEAYVSPDHSLTSTTALHNVHE